MTIQERVAELELIAGNHNALIHLLIAIGDRQQALLEEIQRDGRQMQRLWVRLAERYGWLEDEDQDSP